MRFKLTVIIPFFNAKKYLLQNYKSCLELVNKFNIQIIYIDNNSNDGSFNILKKITANKNFSFLKTKKNLKGPGIGRNLGIQFAESNNLLFLDIDDKLIFKNFKNLLSFISKKKFNFLPLARENISTHKNKYQKFNPYLNYNKNSIEKFLTKSNNMESIGIIYNRKFLIKNKIFFKSGFFEDILFTFKVHFLNTKNIIIFPKKIYLKNYSYHSITNSKITKFHLDSKFNAWKGINLYLKKHLTILKYKKLSNHMQFRWRGELANEYTQICKSHFISRKKKELIRYISFKYKRFIFIDFKVRTTKDKIVRKLLQ